MRSRASAESADAASRGTLQRRLNTSVAFLPPKPKLLDITVRSDASRVSRRMGTPSTRGSSVSMFADAAMNPSRIISKLYAVPPARVCGSHRWNVRCFRVAGCPHAPGASRIQRRGLTIRSSRDRFVAATLCGKLSHRLGHEPVRLNSGVRPLMNNPNPVPHPGYTTSKPFIPALNSLFSELGAQDACLQLQEIAVIHLEKSALAMNAQMTDFLKLLYISNSVPQGTYSFSDMRAHIYNSFISATYAIFERSLKECIAAYKAKNQVTNWVTQIGSAKLDPLSQILHNCTPSEKALLSVPEQLLFDYYRKVRVAGNHVSSGTANNA